MSKETNQILKSGGFVRITGRKCSEKLQPQIKVGSIYEIQEVGATKSGATVLTLKAGGEKTIRCNAERFTWESITKQQAVKEVAEQYRQDLDKCLRRAFSKNDYIRIVYSPNMLFCIAWHYAMQTVEQAARERLSATRLLSRTIREMKSRIDYAFTDIVGYNGYKELQGNSERFINENALYFTQLFFSVKNELYRQRKDIQHCDLRTKAFLAKCFIHITAKWDEEMVRFAQSKVPAYSRNPLPYLNELNDLMGGYMSDEYNLEYNERMQRLFAPFAAKFRDINFEEVLR